MYDLKRNPEINKTGFLFVPKANNILPIIATAIRDKEENLFCFSNSKGNIFQAMDFIIDKYHEINSGRVTMSMLYDAIENVAKTYDMFGLFDRLKENTWNDFKEVVCSSEEETLFAIGVLDEDYKDGDRDPYMTAGGYRSWIANAGTKVYYYINSDLSVMAVFDSNCEVDHYNNNYFGNSTGGGTTNYKLGERVEKRSVRLGREFIDKNWTKTDFKATVKKMDCDKARKICIKFTPDFEGCK